MLVIFYFCVLEIMPDLYSKKLSVCCGVKEHHETSLKLQELPERSYDFEYMKTCSGRNTYYLRQLAVNIFCVCITKTKD
jgi:hypothetical protein